MVKVAMAVVGFFLISVTSVFAQAGVLDLTSIGTYDATGTYYTSYEHTGESPTLTGTAVELSEVVITVDGVDEVVTADALGVWTYTPTVMVAGIYDVEITSEGEVLAFTLTIVESASKGGVVSEGEDVLLDSGIGDYTYLLGFAGLVVLLSAGALVTFKG